MTSADRADLGVSLSATLSFIDRWFGLTDLNSGSDIAIHGGVSGRKNIVLPSREWHRLLDEPTKLADLSGAMNGNVSVWSWRARKGDAAYDAVNKSPSFTFHRDAVPGVWVDFYGTLWISEVTRFAKQLEDDGVGPSFVTGNDYNRTYDYFSNVRMWWPMGEESNMKFKAARNAHLSWNCFVQHKAIQYNLCNGLPIDGSAGMRTVSYPLPGVNGYSLFPFDSEGISSWAVEVAADRYAVRNKDLRDELAVEDTEDYEVMHEHADLPWATLLTHYGWRAKGIDTDTGRRYWAAPGRRTVVAQTLGESVLELLEPYWPSGLKEASDAGIKLDKFMVNLLLGFDGDLAEQRRYFDATRRILPV